MPVNMRQHIFRNTLFKVLQSHDHMNQIFKLLVWAYMWKWWNLKKLSRCCFFIRNTRYDWSSTSFLEMWWFLRVLSLWSKVRRRSRVWQWGGEGRWEAGRSAPVRSRVLSPCVQAIFSPTLGKRLTKLVFVLAKTSRLPWGPGHDILWSCPLPSWCAAR